MFQALRATTETLQSFLLPRLKESLPELFDGEEEGSFELSPQTPESMQEKNVLGVSLWLYRIVRDEHRYNDPHRRVSDNELQKRALPVRLHYLVTPRAGEDQKKLILEQEILGRILQAFHDEPKITGTRLSGDFAGTGVELTVRLEPMTLEEITRVWDALDASYKLSVSYEVSVVFVESGLPPRRIAPVEDVVPRYAITIGSGGGS